MFKVVLFLATIHKASKSTEMSTTQKEKHQLRVILPYHTQYARRNFLVNLFHGTLLVVIISIESGKVIHIIIVLVSIVVVNGQSKLHKTVDTRSESGRLIKAESRSEETGIIKKPDKVLHGMSD